MQGHQDLDGRWGATVDCLWVTRPTCPGPDRLAATPPGREDNKKEAGFTLSSKLSLEEAGYTLRVSSPRGDSNPQHEVTPQCLSQEKSP